MIPDMIHTPYIAPRISVMAPPPVTAERFVDELLSLVEGKFGFFAVESGFDGVREIGDFEILHAHGA